MFKNEPKTLTQVICREMLLYTIGDSGVRGTALHDAHSSDNEQSCWHQLISRQNLECLRMLGRRFQQLQ